jgi:hypothetical protein
MVLTLELIRSFQSFYDPGNNPLNGPKFADRTGLPRSVSRYLGRLFDRQPIDSDEVSNRGDGIHAMGASSGQIDH